MANRWSEEITNTKKPVGGIVRRTYTPPARSKTQSDSGFLNKLVSAINYLTRGSGNASQMNQIRQTQRQEALKTYNTGIAPANQYNMNALSDNQRNAFYRAPGLGNVLPLAQQQQLRANVYAEPILKPPAANGNPYTGQQRQTSVLNSYVYSPPAQGSTYNKLYKDPVNVDLLPDNYAPYYPPQVMPEAPSPTITPPPAYEYPYVPPPGDGGGGGGGGGGTTPTRADVNQWYANMVNWNIGRPRGG